MALRLSESEAAQDDVQRAGAEGRVYHRYEAAPALEVYNMLEPGVKGVGAGPNLIPDAEEHHAG
jgi:hypothetical protein